MQSLVALVACSAVVLWSWRVWWDRDHPLEAAARGLDAGDPSRRLDAVREISELSFGRPDGPIRLLIPALGDRDAGARAAAAEALGRLGANAIALGIGAGEVPRTTAALLALTKDPDDRARAAAAMALAVIVSTADRPARGRRSCPRRHSPRPWTSTATPWPRS